MKRFVLRHVPAIACILLLACLGCSGSPDSVLQASQQDRFSPAQELSLPAPMDIPRTSSAGTILDGADFSMSLPSQAVSADADTAVFSPDTGTQPALQDMAYAIYDISLGGGSAGNPLGLDWVTAPAAADLYLAIAHWTSNRWNWYRPQDVASFSIPQLAGHVSAEGRMLVGIFVTGSDQAVLNGMELPGGGTLQGNWWSFGQDESGNRRSPFTGPDNNNVRWSFLTGHGIVSSAVFATDGTIYTGSYDGYLYAVNPDGTEKWKYQVNSGEGLQSTPAVAADGTVYIGSFDFKLYAINPDGTFKWSFDNATAEIVGSPMIAGDGTVYITSFDGFVYAVNPVDGSEVWKFDTGSAVTGSCSLAADGTVYVGAEAQSTGKYGFFAINPASGVEVWNALEGKIVLSSPAVAEDGTIYTGCEDGTFYAFNPNGTEKWHYDLPILPDLHRASSSAAIGPDGTIYFGTDWESDDDSGGAFFALLSDGTLDWSEDFPDYITGSAAVDAAGNTYFGCYDGFVYSYDNAGNLRWSYETATTDDEIGNSVAGSASIGSDGTVYIGSTGFHLYAFGTSLP